MGPSVERKGKAISSLQVVRLVEEYGERKLFAQLDKKADSAQIAQLLTLLGELPREIERL